MSDIQHNNEHFDKEAGKLGMWIFLFTEMFLFGGLFLVYAVMRAQYSEDFHTAAEELNTFIGTMNTVFLLTSSMTVAMSITAIQRNERRLALFLVYLWAIGFMPDIRRVFAYHGAEHKTIAAFEHDDAVVGGARGGGSRGVAGAGSHLRHDPGRLAAW